MNRNKMNWFLVGLLLVFVFALGDARAQAVYGSLSGTVTDSSGAVVPNAKVTITSIERKTADTVEANGSGVYVKERLLPGSYEIKVEASNFKTANVTSVTVSVDTQTNADVALETGQVSENVTVTAEGTLLKTDRADVATTFTQREVSELPIIDRNFTKLILLTPGTQQQQWGHAASENPQGSTQTIVNGQTFSGTGFQLDGTENRDPILGIIVINPTFESIGETKITSANYDAEFGQAIAGVASVVTKSGTNNIHGSIFEFAQRDRFQARNPFSQATPNSLTGKFIPDSKKDQYGGSIGGRIIKNRLFYFGDYQGTRSTNGGSKLLTVPTTLARTGNLSEYVGTIINPATGLAYVGNIIPACGAGQTAAANGCLSTPAQNILRLLPAPTRSGIRDNFVASGSEKFNNDLFNVRIDGKASDSLNLFGRYSFGRFSLTGPTAFGAAGGPELVSLGGASKVRNQSLALGFDKTLNDTTVLDVRFGYFKYLVDVQPFDAGKNTSSDVGVPGLNTDAFSSGLFAGFIDNGNFSTNFGSGLGVNRCNCPLIENERQGQIVANLSKQSGNHSLKFGIDVRRALNLRVPSDNHRSGELTFGRDRTGNALATFLIGDVTGFRRYTSTKIDAEERQWRHFYYGQDTWKFSPKLTIAYGLRLDVINPQTLNAPGNGGFPDLTTGEVRVAGVGGISSAGNVKNSLNFAPRLGISYQLSQKAVLRAGYGRSYDVGVFGSVFGHTVTQNLPVLAVQNNNAASNTARVFNLSQGPTAFNGFFGITTAANRCPGGNCVNNTAIPASGRFFLPDGVLARVVADKQNLPTVDAYNVTFQYELPKNATIEVAYVGNKGTHVFVGDNPDFNVNQATLQGYGQGPGTPGFVPRNNRRPFFQRFGWTQDVLLYGGYGANNRYNALQTKLTKRFSDGYSLLAHYTFQKAENNSGDQFFFNRDLNRGRADFERTHNFVMTQVWDLPIGRGKRFAGGISKLADAILGGWQINSTTTIQSGFHFNVEYDGGADRDTGPNRPNVGGTVQINGGRDQYLSPSAFSRPAVGTFGNLRRNALTGPGYWRTDGSLFKKIRFTETKELELRIESVNLFNHVNLGNPDAFLGSFLSGGRVSNANFGKITSTAFFGNDLQRNLQFAVRFKF